MILVELAYKSKYREIDQGRLCCVNISSGQNMH